MKLWESSKLPVPNQDVCQLDFGDQYEDDSNIENHQCYSLMVKNQVHKVTITVGFLHCPLDTQSSIMMTMHTSCGRHRWLGLPFRIYSPPEEFQFRLITSLESLEGIINYAGDILVFGDGTIYEAAERDHDRRLVALMERCINKNIKLYRDK